MAGSGAPGRFTTGSTLFHVIEMTVSGSIGLMFMFLVDVAALWWISQLGDERLVAAVGFAWTIQFAAVSVAIGLMIAATALVSRAIGARQRDEARRLASGALVITVATLSAVAAAVWAFRREVLALSGAEGETLEIGASFLAIALPSLPLIAIGMVSASVLRAVGDAWRSMLVTTSAGLFAMVADPVAIVWAGLGVDGAALVIFLARIVAAATGLYLVIRVHNLYARPRLGAAAAMAAPFARIALPAMATQMATPFGNWVLTRAISEFGDGAVAGWGVVSRLTILTFGGIYALSGAVGGIFGQNFGAGQYDRVAQAYLDALKFCAVYTLVAWAGLALMQETIVAGFGLSADGAAVVRAFNSLAAGAFICVGGLFVANSAFNNLGRPLWSTWFNWSRDGLLTFPCAMGLAAWLAAPGVIYGQAVAGLVSGCVAAWVGWRFVSRLGARASAPICDADKEA